MKNSGNFFEKSYQIQQKLRPVCFNFSKEIFKRENLEMTVKLGMTHAQLINAINSDIGLIKDQGSKIITKEFPASETETSSVQLDIKCQGKDYMFVFMDYGILEPSNYSLSADGLTVNFSPVIPANHKIIIRYFTPGSSFTNYVTDEFQSNLLNYTTNRILEIPQDIKLELNNDTLTLKAGSKVYAPNGFETDGVTPKFDVKTVPNDLSWTFNQTNDLCFVTPENTQNTVLRDYCFSGSTAPTSFQGGQYAIWYDTTNNFVKFTNDAGSTWSTGTSLPYTSISSDNSYNTFNGFGYIGSTVFALPGVKCQFADSRNENGTPKSFIKTLDKVATATYIYQTETYKPQTLTIASDLSLRHRGFAYTQNNRPDTTDSCWFCPKDNKTYKTTHTAPISVEQQVYEVVAVENIETDSSFNIISFQPKTVSSINQYDMNVLSAMSMPSNKYIDLTLGASGTKYTAPANGYFMLRKKIINKYKTIFII